MRAAKALKRESGAAPEYPQELPQLRKRIVITDYDFGEVVYTARFYTEQTVLTAFGLC